ncbi:leucine-rich repeat-containing protein 40-like isoform X2 [Oscarella lobularis]|uniref:leucine-rich repeat-containing protein 40-like isoform X2 n=1 Tax=Oscarella lobularis TaxID=121494 RepID=UPI00331343FC
MLRLHWLFCRCSNSSTSQETSYKVDETGKIIEDGTECAVSVRTFHKGRCWTITYATEQPVTAIQLHSIVEQIDKTATSLTISDCMVMECPVLLGSFHDLTLLNLSHNELTDLPWSIIYLKNLRELDLTDNYLTTVPQNVQHLKNLSQLKLNYNAIACLPVNLLNLPLTVLEGLPAIKSYLEAKSKRADSLAEWTQPWVNNESARRVESLTDLCVKSILKSRVNFLEAQYLPPLLKSRLARREKQKAKRTLKIMKCSECKRYFTTNDNFEQHNCDNITVTKL